ncbi:MAG TPA: hypothetical protein VF634_01980 [Pyrinomonadaceae bacterium]
MRYRMILAGALLSALCFNSPAVALRQKRRVSKVASETAAHMSLNTKIRRFAPTTLTADTSRLSSGDRRALAKIIEAAKLLDPLYLRQVWSGNPALLARLEADKTPEGRARLHYFRINVGPWSRLDGNEPFIEGVPHEKPKYANYYPEDMSKEEFNSWVQTLGAEQKAHATGFFHLIRRDPGGKLKTVPYSVGYREFLEPAARLLREAADLTTNATLKSFLVKRADAFLSDDYYESDVAWMDLDAPIDVTIGPYETYEDELFNYKAAFESYVTLRDEAESAKLAKFSKYLQELEDNLPMEARYRNPKLGAASPIRVVNQVFSSGEGALHRRADHAVAVEHGFGLRMRAFGLQRENLARQFDDGRFNARLVDAKSPGALVELDRALVGQIVELHGDAFAVRFRDAEAHGAEATGKEGRVHRTLHALFHQPLVHQILQRPQPRDVGLRLFDGRGEFFQLHAHGRGLPADFDVVRPQPVHQLVREDVREERFEGYISLVSR